MANNINLPKGKIIENVMPVLSGTMASPFCACFASLVLSQSKRFNRNAKNAQKRLWAAYHSAITASGLSFSYVYKNSYYSKYNKTDYYRAFNDEWLKYTLSFGKCNYHMVMQNDENLVSEILNSIERGIPVLAEGLSDSSWCLVVGYDNDGGRLYGYMAKCPNCKTCVGCIQTRVDGYVENGLFYKSKWEKVIKRAVIIDGFDAQPYDYKIYISHWVSIMQHEPQSGFLFGPDAYDAVIELLSHDDIFNNADNESLQETYKFLFTNSFIPEYRAFAGVALSGSKERRALLDHMGIFSDTNADIQEGIASIKSRMFSMHKIGWDYWAALSEEKVWKMNPEEYMNELRNSGNRLKAIGVLKRLKEIDLDIFCSLKDILNKA